MAGRRRFTRVRSDGAGRASVVAAELGRQTRDARRRRRWTQAELARRVDVTQTWISELERGFGAGAPLEVWYAISGALGVPLRVEFTRDPEEQPADAGHLAIQELLLRLARANGLSRSFEVPTRPADPSRSADVFLRDDRRRVLYLLEAWNSVGDIGAAVRSTRRKEAEAQAFAVAAGGASGPYRVAVCWVMRATGRNRTLVGRYPEVFAATFRGSSRGWTEALATGTDPPAEPGLVWCDTRTTRVRPWVRPRPNGRKPS